MNKKLFFSLRFALAQLLPKHGSNPMVANVVDKMSHIEAFLNKKDKTFTGRDYSLSFDDEYPRNFKLIATLLFEDNPSVISSFNDAYQVWSEDRAKQLVAVKESSDNEALQSRLRSLNKADAWKQAVRDLEQADEDYQKEKVRPVVSTLEKASVKVLELEQILIRSYDLGVFGTPPKWVDDHHSSFKKLTDLCQDATELLDKEFDALIKKAEQVTVASRSFLTKIDAASFPGQKDWDQTEAVKATEQQLVSLEQDLEREQPKKKEGRSMERLKEVVQQFLPGSKSVPTQVKKSYDAVPFMIAKSPYSIFCYKFQQYSAFKEKFDRFEQDFIQHVEVALPRVMQSTHKPMREESKQKLTETLATLDQLGEAFPDEQPSKAQDAFRSKLKQEWSRLWTRESELQSMTLPDLKAAMTLLVKEGFPDAPVKFDVSDPTSMLSSFTADEAKQQETFSKLSAVVQENFADWLERKKTFYSENATTIADKLTATYQTLTKITASIETESIQAAIKDETKTKWKQELTQIRARLDELNTNHVKAGTTLNDPNDLIEQHKRLTQVGATNKQLDEFIIRVNHTLSESFREKQLVRLKGVQAKFDEFLSRVPEKDWVISDGLTLAREKEPDQLKLIQYLLDCKDLRDDLSSEELVLDKDPNNPVLRSLLVALQSNLQTLNNQNEPNESKMKAFRVLSNILACAPLKSFRVKLNPIMLEALPKITWENYSEQKETIDNYTAQLIKFWRQNLVHAYQEEESLGIAFNEYLEERVEFQNTHLKPIQEHNREYLPAKLRCYANAIPQFEQGVKPAIHFMSAYDRDKDILEDDRQNLARPRTAETKIAEWQDKLFSYLESMTKLREDLDPFDGIPEERKPKNAGLFLCRLENNYNLRKETKAYTLATQLRKDLIQLREEHQNNLSDSGLRYLDETSEGLATLMNQYLASSPPEMDNENPDLPGEQEKQHKAFAKKLTKYIDERLQSNKFKELATAFKSFSAIKKLLYNFISAVGSIFGATGWVRNRGTEAGKHANSYFNQTRTKSRLIYKAVDEESSADSLELDDLPRSATNSPMKYARSGRAARV